MLPAGSIIEADTENNCFSFVDSEGNSERYTVVYDDYYEAYYLRLADYSAETFKEEYSTHTMVSLTFRILYINTAKTSKKYPHITLLNTLTLRGKNIPAKC